MEPRRRRFTDPCSEIVWAAIKTLDESLQYQLLRELSTELAIAVENPRTPSDKVLAAVHALKVVADVLDHSSSVKDYRAVREALPELNLPPDGTIRRWLGASWNGCLRRAFLEAVTDGDFASRPIGLNDRYDDEEVLQATRECTSELGHAPTITEYFQWARRPDVRERPGRRPLSFQPFMRFGGLRAALVAAGVIGENGARYAANGRVLPLRYRYRNDDITGALLMVAARLGRSPRPAEYQMERQRIHDELLPQGEIRPLPSMDVVRKRYGFWNAALEKAALAPVADPSHPNLGKRYPSYSPAEKLDWIRRAWAECGEPFTAATYKRWRVRTIKTTGAAIPCLPNLERTFGGWKRARELALPGGGAGGSGQSAVS